MIKMTNEECTTYLAEARAALHSLNLGTTVVEVRNENTQVRYSAANRDALVQYIKDLESQCGCGSHGTRRAPLGVQF